MANGNGNGLEQTLWAAADQLRANSQLTTWQYSSPVLGLIFLRYTDHKFTHAEKEIKKASGKGKRRGISKTDFQARGILYLRDAARYASLLNLPEGADIGRALNEAMKSIEEDNEELRGVLPKTYHQLENDVLVTLLKQFDNIPMDIEGDVFGKIYEYFLGKFAMSEGQRGGEFFTPTSIVKLIVEVIEPYQGRILDPACGSAGMFVQSAKFVKRHKKNPTSEISVFGQEKVAETIRQCKMSLAVHGLSGDVKQGNSYYEDIHNSVGRFDFVMANPPFNVDGVDKEKLKTDKRFPYGLPKPDNANYIWIQIFLSALNEKGRAGFVMANSASDARQSELEIRKQIVEDRFVDVMIAIGSNFFYNVTLPVTLWFFDKGKRETERKDKVLFIDARHIYNQIDRAHRDFLPEQTEFLANIVRLYRDEDVETEAGSKKLMKDAFPDVRYQDVAGLCKLATLDEVREHGYSLNPGRYVGVADKPEEEFEFYERLEEFNEKLEQLNLEAHELEGQIVENANRIIER
jgi:type I restriction enzyme M protein